jgi:hypothetical protein
LPFEVEGECREALAISAVRRSRSCRHPG